VQYLKDEENRQCPRSSKLRAYCCCAMVTEVRKASSGGAGCARSRFSSAVQARTAILHVVALTQYRSNRYMMGVRVTATASSPGEVAIVGPKSRK
jgi:hypothetical protein